jgi:hypothetical protein
MSENQGESRSFWIVLVNLALLLGCLLVMMILLLAFRLFYKPAAVTPGITQTRRPTATAAPPVPFTLTPTASRTLIFTRTSTYTLTPSITPTVPVPNTPAPGLVPMSTPAKPLTLKGAYELKPWSPEQADQMAQMMQSYPATIGTSSGQAYYDAYQYPVFALKEALSRYPDATQAESWRWMLAYDLALMNDEQAGEEYARLIADGLNNGSTELEYLYYWFTDKEPRLELFMTETAPPSGYLNSYLIELRNDAGSAFITLLRKASGYEAYPLLTHFDFIKNPQANWVLSDLDGSKQNGDEIAIYFSTPPDQMKLDAPLVFNLGQVEPKVMPFLPNKDIFDVGQSYTNNWSAPVNGGGFHDLRFQATLYPTCPITVTRDYRWNNLYFRLAGDSYRVNPPKENLGACEGAVDHAAATWGPAAAIPIMETLLPNWPPAKDASGNPYPADALDQWRYRLGVYHSLLGHYQTAVDYMNQVSTHPVVYNSRWIAPAQKFLNAYKKAEDVYVACQPSLYCDPTVAIQYLVSGLPSGKDALQALWALGVKTSSSGYFDFDGDGEAERWFTVRNQPREKLQFWILAQTSGGVEALPVAYIDTTQPTLDYLEPAYIGEGGQALQPAVLLDGSLSFSMQRRPDDQSAYLVPVPLRKEYPSRFFVPLQAYAMALQQGASAEVIQQKLVDLQTIPGLLCRTTWTCDSYYYLLGLAAELAGDDLSAADAYQQLWLNYSKSPYTQMARLKLQPAVLAVTVVPSVTPLVPTPSPLPTLLILPSQTLQPTVTLSFATPSPTPSATGGTITPTLTGTTSGTPGTTTATLTPTTTTTGTVSPSPTYTLTPTPTITVTTYP